VLVNRLNLFWNLGWEAVPDHLTRKEPLDRVVSKYWMRLKTQEVRESVLVRSTACHGPLRDAALSRCA
jgi:hypothetical protein